MEAEACHSLGVAQHALGDHAASVRHHRAELELAHRLGLTHLQVSCITGTLHSLLNPGGTTRRGASPPDRNSDGHLCICLVPIMEAEACYLLGIA